MSQQLKTPDQQLNAESRQSATQQKKIDPVAQLNWINNQKVDQGWGIFDNNQPAQLSTQEGELKQIESEEENQISAGEALHNDIDNAIQARFGTPVIQMQTEEEPENKYESYKSKAFKTTQDAPLSNLTEKEGEISVSDIKVKEKYFEVNSTVVIPKDLKVLILGSDFSFEKFGKKYVKKEVAQVKIIDESNPEWNNKIVWTTRTNVSTTEDENGLFKIIAGDANVRESAVEVDGVQKTIPKDTEIVISEFKMKGNKIYLKVSNKETKEDYGWINASSLGQNIYNESFGIEKATYISEDENHSTINKNGTLIYKEENKYNYDEYLKEDGNYVLIPNGAKIIITNTDGNFSEVESVDGKYYGWTSKGNYKKTEESNVYEIKDPDARLREKKRAYISTGKTLSVGEFVITKGIAENDKYTKISQTEKIDDSYTEKSDSEGYILTENLTGKWADVKGKHATWVKGRYTGQINLVSTMGASGANAKMRYMKEDSENSENDMFDKYLKMVNAAESAGVVIELISGFRTYPEQKYLDDHENDPGFNTAATPGWSPHQNGIAIDINSKHTEDLSVNKWLMRNSYKYGFVKPLKMGYEEAHHWEYQPNNTRDPETITEESSTKTRYFFATWSPDKAWSDNDSQKWYATYYEE